MTAIQKKIIACFMGFSILTIFNIHNTFAKDLQSINKMNFSTTTH